jgi:hypothetical protein
MKFMDIAGKAAVEMETATAFTKIEDKLFARLKTAIEPVIKVDAWPGGNWLIDPPPKPSDLAPLAESFFTTLGSFTLKFGLYLNPKKIMKATLDTKMQYSAKHYPHAKPVMPILGARIKIPVIIPILIHQWRLAVRKKSVKNLQNSRYHI